MSDYFCNCCGHFVEEDGAERNLTGFSPNTKEPFEGLRCPYCHQAELDEIDQEWVIGHIKEAARHLKPQFQKGMRQLAERLEYAADFLETEA